MQDDGVATNDSDDHDWPVCYTTLGGPDGIVEMKTEVQIASRLFRPTAPESLSRGRAISGTPQTVSQRSK